MQKTGFDYGRNIQILFFNKAQHDITFLDGFLLLITVCYKSLMLFEELHIQICFGLNYNLENIDKSFSVNMHATHAISHIIKPQLPFKNLPPQTQIF